jgi:hypothetical protein
MFEEITKAKKKAEEQRALKKEESEKRMRDREAKAISDKKVEKVECDVCAEDRPSFHMASCNGKEKHTYCIWCVKTHIENIIGAGQYATTCMTPDCKGLYPRSVLQQLLDNSTVSRIEHLQQNSDLAKVKGMVECPFCRIKAFCETPTTFDCHNPECLMSTCRKCKDTTHPGMSCAEYGKKKKEDTGDDLATRVRHEMEEAMTKALVRYCPYVLKHYIFAPDTLTVKSDAVPQLSKIQVAMQ